MHELGHSNQRSHGVNKFIFCSKLVRESWAEAVEWAFVMHKYFPNTITNSSSRRPFLTNQIMGATLDGSLRNYPRIRWSFELGEEAYTPIFIDLLDCDNSNTNSTIGFNENICSYTLKEIEQAIANKGWSASVTPNLNSIENYLIDNYGIRGGSLQRYFDVYRENY
jgi:hypothetical protein